MTKFVSFRWKKEFQDIEWYKANPAEKYLDTINKLWIMELYILQENDSDAEAECFIEEYNNTN
jgi:hypothetical protein